MRLGAPIHSFLCLSLVMLLSACTERSLEMAFLNPAILNKSEFKITNENNGDLLPDATESSIQLEAECSANIQYVEIQNPDTKVWTKSTELIAGGDTNCADDSKISFSIPSSYAAPFMPSVPGDFRQPFQIRWAVKNHEGEISVYYKTLNVLFKAPSVSATSDLIGPNQVANGYTVSGTCSKQAGFVEVTDVFATKQTVTCDSGTYSLNATLKSPITSGPLTYKVKHAASASSRAYAEIEKTVTADLDAPEILVTKPAAGAILTDADYSTGTAFAIAGTCSEDLLPVNVKVNGLLSTSFTCSATKEFSGDIVLPEGASDIQVQQTDAVGNETSVTVSVTKDTSGPGDFTITGVQSTVDDNTIDNVLTGTVLRVDFSNSVDAVSYDVQIKDMSGTIICPTRNVTTGYAVFSGCTLTNGVSYKVYASAKDNLARVTTALNDAYTFSVQLPVPAITRAYSDSTNVTYRAGDAIVINLQFSRSIVVSGSPRVTLNTGETVNFSSGSVVAGTDNKLFRFTYFPGVNIDVNALDISDVSANGGTLKDAVNGTDANLALPTAPSSRLTASNIGIDSVAPGTVTGLSITAIPKRIDLTPTISFTAPADPDPLTYWMKVSRQSDNLQIMAWSQVALSTTGILLNNALVEPGVQYRVEVQVKDPHGNAGGIAQSFYVSTSCPANFAYVYNEPYQAQPFCVARYEAKVNANAPQFIPTGAPVSATLMQAIPACNSLGVGYTLISNNQWNAVADLIVRRAENWTNNSVGVGILHRGNNQIVSLSAVQESDPCWPQTDTALCASNGNKRKHILPFNQSVWDMAGNAMELVSDTDSVSPQTADYVSMLAASAVKTKYGTNQTCSAPSGVDYCGFGRIDLSNNAGNVIWRGGSSVSTAPKGIGVFSAIRSGDASTIFTDGGFRCVYEL
ncbi:hypothetical protein [Bdellovibrio bacteriovorus]|nr:hypothetical protein [Bdellovibrio bacteriovorus]